MPSVLPGFVFVVAREETDAMIITQGTDGTGTRAARASFGREGGAGTKVGKVENFCVGKGRCGMVGLCRRGKAELPEEKPFSRQGREWGVAQVFGKTGRLTMLRLTLAGMQGREV